MNRISNFDELDQAIAAAMAGSAGEAWSTEVNELLKTASDLKYLPRPDFKLHLKRELEWLAAARPLSPARPLPVFQPTLFGKGYGAFSVRQINFAVSLGVHAVAAVLILALGTMALRQPRREVIKSRVISLAEYVPPVGNKQPRGGGNGGASDPLNASKGALPRSAAEQLTPPVVVIHNPDPKLAEEPTIIAPDLHVPQTSQMGDPLSHLMTPSSGPGVHGGIGTGTGGGVGNDGQGPGYGPGVGGNYGDKVFSVGNGISAPRLVYDPEPEYSQEARLAKYQGSVTLVGVIGPDGRPHALRVEHSLGMGLDEKAIEAVNNWRFDPARKDGRAVPVMIEIEVSFHLY